MIHYTTMLLGKEPPGEAANPGLIQRSHSEAPGRGGVCMGTGAGKVRATDYRKEVLTRARRVSHVFRTHQYFT